MKIAIIGDSYPPIKTSAASMIHDLACEFSKRGQTPIVITPDSCIEEPVNISYEDNIKIIRVKNSDTKNINYFKRAILEFLMPFSMIRKLKKSNILDEKLDGVIWYSPSIFYGPLVYALKRNSRCNSYLILRDIFPEWAVDLGLMSRGPSYLFFKLVENFQYLVADTIGYQSPGNEGYFMKKRRPTNQRLEVLYNWISETKHESCSIILNKTSLAGRKIFVYTGNMGIAQNIRGILPIIEFIDKNHTNIGFIFVGSGEDADYLSKEIKKKDIQNTLIYEEIPHNQLPSLFDQCDFGIVSLDARHQTQNIPGKFIAYIKNGLPVLACINEGNDLHKIIEQNHIGKSYVGFKDENLIDDIIKMANDDTFRVSSSTNCRKLADEKFSSSNAYKQIFNALGLNLKQ